MLCNLGRNCETLDAVDFHIATPVLHFWIGGRPRDISIESVFPLFQAAEGEETTLERTQRHVMFDPRHASLARGWHCQRSRKTAASHKCKLLNLPCWCNQFGDQNRRNWTSWVQSTCVADGACTVSDNLSSCALKLDSKLEIVGRVLVSECVLVLSTYVGIKDATASQMTNRSPKALIQPSQKRNLHNG